MQNRVEVEQIRALLAKLRQLKTEERIFKDPLPLVLENQNNGFGSSLTEIAYSVISSLSNLINTESVEMHMNPDGVDRFIALVEELQTIFP